MANQAPTSNRPSTAAAPLPGVPSSETGKGGLSSMQKELGRKRLGFGCLGMIIIAVFGVHSLIMMWLADPWFALVVAALIGAWFLLVSRARGYHFWSGIAYCAGALVVFAAAPLLTSLISPVGVTRLPELMQNSLMMGLFTGAGGLGLVVALWRMRSTISWAEMKFSIQLNAAARQTDPAQMQRTVHAALVRLAACSAAGVWPLSADFLHVGDFQPNPRDRGDAFVPLLAVRLIPDEAELTPFDHQPWITPPEAPVPVKATLMRPIAVGTLFCDREHLCFAPVRQRSEPLEIHVDKLTRYKLRAHGFELEYENDGQLERVSFESVHAWRVLTLAAFLHVFATELSESASVLWATHVRPGRDSESTERFSNAEPVQNLSQRLDEILAAGPLAKAPARSNAETVLNQLLCSERPALRLLAVEVLGALESVSRNDPEAWAHILAAETLEVAVPSDHLPGHLDEILTDIAACHWLSLGEFDVLRDVVAEFDEAHQLDAIVSALANEDAATVETLIADLTAPLRDTFFVHGLRASAEQARSG